MSSTRGRRRSCAVGCALLLAGFAPGLLEAQNGSRFFPSRSLLPDLMAGPRDPVVAIRALYLTSDPTAYPDGFGTEVSLAATLPVLRLRGSSMDDALVLGVEAATFARFSLEVMQRELVNTDWVFTLPLVQRFPNGWLRLRYYHTSSHLGDEYEARFDGVEAVNFIRDAFDVTGYARVAPAMGVYGVAARVYHAHPEDHTHWLLRAGTEISATGPGGPHGPFLAVDLQLDQMCDWETTFVGQAGVWIGAVHDRPLRVALEVLAGRSPMGQFHGRQTTRLALALLWNP